jgi:plasmid stabilization system protein ParE
LRIVWAPEAADDLDAAVGYLAERNAGAASKLAESVVALVEWLASTPVDGPSEGDRERILDGQGTRGQVHLVWPGDDRLTRTCVNSRRVILT